jgi:hypothetical protein
MDVMPLQASSTKRELPPAMRMTLPSRAIVAPKACRNDTAAEVTSSWSSKIAGVSQALGSGSMKTRKAMGNARARSPRRPRR